MRRIGRITLYPWLLSLYMIAYLYGLNLSNIRPGDVGEVLLVVWAATAVFYGAGSMLTRDYHKAGALTGTLALVFLTYGHILIAFDARYSQPSFLMPAILLVMLLVIIVIIRSKTTIWSRLTPYLNILLVVLLIMPSWQIMAFFIGKPGARATGRANPYEQWVAAPTANNTPQIPDIYYIILDGYSSNSHWAREFGYDNSAFTDALEARGFYVAHESRSNYPVTIVSLPSSLNMRYIADADREAARQNDVPDRVYLRSLIANNRVAYELKLLGYQYYYVLSGYLSPSTLADVNIAFYPEGPEHFSGANFQLDGRNGSWAYEQPFLPFFLETTLLVNMASRFEGEEPGQILPRYSPRTILWTFEELERIASIEAATFTFAHIIKPHLPIQFDRDGNLIDVDLDDYDPEKPRYFFEELQFLNNRVLELVDHLLSESSVPPIIVIQADHGSYLGNPSPEMGDWHYFEILNALYLPGGYSGDARSFLSPVNTFRVIFNNYFDGNYELLESEQYLVPNGWSDGDYFTYVPYIDDQRLNRELGDHIALIYNITDASGASELRVYNVMETGEPGELLMAINHDAIAPYIDNPPEENRLIVREGQVAFYALTTGEFQFNLGPDAQGREWAVIIDTLPPETIYGYQVGSNQG